MNILFIDLETTGKANFNGPSDSEFQPRIVQLGALLCDYYMQEMASVNIIIKPRIEIPKEAAAIHGITNERAKEFGVMAFHALYVVQNLLKRCELVVAHNHQFDWFVLQGEFARESIDLPARDGFCTMKAMTPICKLPGTYDKYKWPRLGEAYQHAFKKELKGAHDAMADVRACKEIYYWLKNTAPEIPSADPPRLLSTEELAQGMRKAAQ
jgi:DNA polymerase-3 subunit epsilon